MGNKYDNNNIYHMHHLFHRKNIFFLPIFCRLSIKDIKLNNHHRRIDDDHQTISDDEPSSPKVSCMGQVKRNNRITGFPASTAISTSTHHNNNKYSKLKKLFSSKALLPAPTINNNERSRSKSCRIISSKEVMMSSCHDVVEVVNVKELDPPLPVVKRTAPAPGVEMCIWKRRFNNGAPALKGLQIDSLPPKLSSCNSQPLTTTTTV